MEKQNRLLTVLAVILLALVAVAVLWKTDDKEDAFKDPHAPPTHKLLTVESGDVVKLSLTTGSNVLSFAKTDGTWTMTAPSEMAVEGGKVSEIVDRLIGVSVEERSLTGDAGGYGLDAAARTEVKLEKADGTAFTVYIGKDSAVGWKTYIAEKDGGPALLASTKLADLVHKSRDDFRSKDVWQVSPGTAKRVRITTSTGDVVLRKDDHGWWLGDSGPRVDEEHLQEWLDRAAGLKAHHFAEDTAASDAFATLTVEDADGTHDLKLLPASDDGMRVAGSQAVLNADTASMVQLDGWTSGKLMPVHEAQVDRVEIQLGDKSAKFTRKDGVWLDAAGKPAQIVEGLLTAVGGAVADRTATVPAIAVPWGKIILSEGDDRKESVVIGETVGDNRIVKDDAGGPPFTVKATDFIVLAATLP